MKLSIDIPDETLQAIAERLLIREIESMLSKWAVTPRTQQFILSEWEKVEAKVLESIFRTSVGRLRDKAVVRVKRNLTGHIANRIRDEAVKIAKVDPKAVPKELDLDIEDERFWDSLDKVVNGNVATADTPPKGS